MQFQSIEIPARVAAAIARLEAKGFEAWAVGGCVRDSFLKRTPNDWDITTVARPADVAAVFADCRTVETGIKHGTLTVIFDGMPLEITTYRSDGAYADNRHPIQVTFSDAVEDDLARRDFTVNAMAYHPVRGLVDPFHGKEDLAAGILSCVGTPETRFGEDGLRILRAIRFASVLDFEIEPKTAAAIHSCRSLLSNIAAERIREEFCKLIGGKGAIRILREYIDVIAEFLPELGACRGVEQNTKYHCFDVWEHSLQSLAYTTSSDLVTRLTILLHDIGKPLCKTTDAEGDHFKGHGPVGTRLVGDRMKRMRFDNRTIEDVVQLVDYHDRAIPAEPKAVKRLMQKMSDENILRLMEVQRCDRLAHAPDYSEPSPAVWEIPRILQQIRADEECISLKTLAVSGDDLIAMGLPRGKEIGRILTLLLDEVIDGTLENEKETLLRKAQSYQFQ